MNKVVAMYFSGTGTTKKTVETIAEVIAKKLGLPMETADFTLPEGREKLWSFDENSLVVFGVPVYAGRVPNVLLPFLNGKIEGHQTLAVPVVLFGNRNYDDALMELTQLLTAHGFKPMAGAAFIGEHSFSTILGGGRPDEQDMEIIRTFAEKAADCVGKGGSLTVGGNDPVGPYYTPRDRKGNPVNILKVKPKVNEVCNNCGVCVSVCPMGSISAEDVSVYTGICIKCGACIKKCPVGARYYDDAGYLYHQHELEEGYARRAEPSCFYISE